MLQLDLPTYDRHLSKRIELFFRLKSACFKHRESYATYIRGMAVLKRKFPLPHDAHQR